MLGSPFIYFVNTLTYWLQLKIFIYSWLWGYLLKHGWSARSYTLKENWLLLPQKLSTVYNSPVSAGACMNPFPFHARMLTGLILSWQPELLWVHGYNGSVLVRRHCVAAVCPDHLSNPLLWWYVMCMAEMSHLWSNTPQSPILLILISSEFLH